MTMNLRALRMFVATADSGSLGRACVQLNVSQPAASRQIHTLETELGVPLFHRAGRQLQLTSAGHDLLLRGRRLLAEADFLSEEARALREGRKGILKIGATPQMMTALLTSFLPRHQRRHPGIEIQLVERGRAQQWNELFERGEIDLAMAPASGARYPGRLLFPLHVLAVLPKTHRLGRHELIDVAELVDEPLLLLRREFGTRAFFDAACEIAQVIPRVLLECSAAHTLIGLAAVAYGIAIVPSIATIEDESLRAVPLVVLGSSIGHWQAVCWDPRRLAPAYQDDFVKELVAHAKHARPGHRLLRRAPPLPKPGRPFN
jgi:LysR family transcriptional regulator, cyn operon transcriptional activator